MLQSGGTTAAALSRLAERHCRLLWCVLLGVPAAFLVSTIPGVRPHLGYNLLLDGVLNNLAYAAAPVICALRARRASSYRMSWLILSVGLAVYGLGNIYWTIAIRPLDPEPFPSGADACWLAFYPCAFAALMLVLREQSGRMPASLWLDGIVGGLAVSGIAAAAVVGPIVSSAGGGSFAAVATTTAYPLLDGVLLLVVVATLSLFHWRPPVGLWALTGGILLFVVADIAYLFATARGTYQSGGVIDGIWVLGTVLMALAPGWRNVPTGVQLPAWAIFSLPIISALAAMGLLVYDHSHRLHPVAIGLAASTIVLALGRLMLTFREVASLAQSHKLALTDELTGLANRRALYEYATKRLSGLIGPRHAALLLMDLDRFKEVNDSLGHHAGDEMLRQVATRLQSCVTHDVDLLVRLGGDEFAVLMEVDDERIAETLAARIRAALGPSFIVDGVTVRVDASIGIALSRTAHDSLPTLLRQADVAMYHAKTRRIGQSVYTAQNDMLGGQDRLQTLEELRQAIDGDGRLVVHYQPKVDARTMAVTGVEALVRWNHSTRGLLYPDSFLPLVEDAGLMRDLTSAVLAEALDQVVLWHAAGRHISVAVNLSASCLVDIDLPERIELMLSQRALHPSSLELEITEDFLMADRERAREILSRLRDQGIKVVVDDFGTGYSSLAYLRELPIDELKLDKCFVTDMADDPGAAAIVRSTIGLAHSLGLRMVAEGVENETTAAVLAQSGCDVAQGFFFARALPAAQLEAWLDDWALPSADRRAPGWASGRAPA